MEKELEGYGIVVTTTRTDELEGFASRTFDVNKLIIDKDSETIHGIMEYHINKGDKVTMLIYINYVTYIVDDYRKDVMIK